MKKFKPTILLTAMTLFIGHMIYAQDVAANDRSLPPIVTNESKADLKPETPAAPVIANPDVKMVAALTAAIPAATAQEWRLINNGYYVTFLNNGRKAKAMFSHKGKMNYAITDCNLEQLPDALRKKITAGYPGYSFVSAIEILAYDAKAHQAVLQNAAGYVTLKATKDGIEEIDTQKKAEK